MKRKLAVVCLCMCLIASFMMIGCNGGGSSSTAPGQKKCLEVSRGGTILGFPSWNVSLKNGAGGETLKTFPLAFTAACVSKASGEQIACYQNAVVEDGELVSFDATIDDEEYSYPEDRC